MFKAKKKENQGIEISIDVDGKKHKFKLSEPTFEVKSLALQKYMSGTEADHVSAGRIIFDSCFTGGTDELLEIKSDSDVYLSICFKCASLLRVYEVELKKN